MSTRLELPPPRDLPTERRREIRAALVRASHRRRHPRRWLVTVPVAVLTLLLGLGLGLTRPWDTGTPLVGVPADSRTASLEPSPGPDRSTPTPTPAPAFPSARVTDRGALSTAARKAVVRRCLADLGRSTAVKTVHFARSTSSSGDVVLFTARDGQSYSCSDDGSGLYDGSGSKTLPLPEPDAKHAAVLVEGEGLWSSSGKGRVQAHTSAAYRVSEEVVSLQSRLTVEGHSSPWFEASRADGWAWTGATLSWDGSLKPDLHREYRIDVRAFDADGKRLGVDRTPR